MLPLALYTSLASADQIASEKKVVLDFNTANFTTKTLDIDGHKVTYRAYENIVYVEHPVDSRAERMNIYIPEAYYKGESIGRFNAHTAPIFMPNTIGGYMPSEPENIGLSRDGKNANAAAMALAKGYIVAAPGTRGRISQDSNGRFIGKAPAAIVDLKAAVRYLRHNDRIMYGDAEKIISNGTSAGGALSALLGATGNSKDYEPYLKEIGAANERDDIFAVSAYCPITDIDHADMAYEWLFSGQNQYKAMVMPKMIDWHVERNEIKGSLSPDQIKISQELKALFPNYLNSLQLKGNNNQLLTLNAKGEGPFKELVKSYLMTSAQKAIDQGNDLSKLKWLTIKAGKVTQVHLAQYAAYIMRMKTPPAFDGLDLSTGENELFGSTTVKAKHFTTFGQIHDTAHGSMADSQQIKMMNPIYYIGSQTAQAAQHWRIRHGTLDRDTSLAVPVILATQLSNNGIRDVDLAFVWNKPHSGDYDLDELFVWMEKTSVK